MSGPELNGWPLERRAAVFGSVAVIRSPSASGMPQRRMRTRRHEISDRAAWVLPSDEGLTDKDCVSTGPGVLDEGVRPAHARLCDAHDPTGDECRQPGKRRTIDLQSPKVSRVDADDARACVYRALDIVLVMDLDEWRQPDRLGSPDSGYECRVVE